MFLPTAISLFSIAAISFVIVCIKLLKFTVTPFFRMLMSKKENNEVSKDTPIGIHYFVLETFFTIGL